MKVNMWDKPFYVTFSNHDFRVGDALGYNGGIVKVIRVYHKTWWKEAIRKIVLVIWSEHINFRYNQIRVKPVKKP